MDFPAPQTSLQTPASDWIESEVGIGGGLSGSLRPGTWQLHGGKALEAKRRLGGNLLRVRTQSRRSIIANGCARPLTPNTSNTSSSVKMRKTAYGVFTP